MQLIEQAGALVFDFDGTLVDSNAIKWRAFDECFAQFPDRYDEIRSYCYGNYHTPRGEKFRYVYEKILGLSFTDEIKASLHSQFAAASTRQIIEAAEIPGAGEFLRAIKTRYLTALLSSTPHEVLLHIVGERGWRDFFQEIQGAPVDKKIWLDNFQAAHNLSGAAVVFFGDTKEDSKAALAAGCGFVAVGEGCGGDPRFTSVSDFEELLPVERKNGGR